MMETGSAAAIVMERADTSVFDFLAEAQAAGIVPHCELADLAEAAADALTAWMSGCAQISRHADDLEWLSSHVITRMCEARGAAERGEWPAAILRGRLAEYAAALLTRLLLRMDACAVRAPRVGWDEIEGWR